MYVQMTTIRVLLNQVDYLHEMIATEYFPLIRTYPGFQAGFLMEHAQEPNSAQLVLFWRSYADVENFNCNGLLQESLNALAITTQDVRLQNDNYIVKISAGSHH